MTKMKEEKKEWFLWAGDRPGWKEPEEITTARKELKDNWKEVKAKGCAACYYDRGDTWPEFVRPCGQFQCMHPYREEWVFERERALAIAERLGIWREKEGEEENGLYKYKIEKNLCQFIFNGKPSEEVRHILKSHSFKWSPTRSAWVRQASVNGVYASYAVLNALAAREEA